MRKTTRISAVVDATTKDLLERYARATGVERGILVEEALRHYLRALQELPADAIVPSRIVVTRESYAVLVERARRAKPTQALRNLMRRGD